MCIPIVMTPNANIGKGGFMWPPGGPNLLQIIRIESAYRGWAAGGNLYATCWNMFSIALLLILENCCLKYNYDGRNALRSVLPCFKLMCYRDQDSCCCN